MKNKSFKNHLENATNNFFDFKTYQSANFSVSVWGEVGWSIFKLSNSTHDYVPIFKIENEKTYICNSVAKMETSTMLKNVIKYVLKRFKGLKLKVLLEGSKFEKLQISNGNICVNLEDLKYGHNFNLEEFKFENVSSQFEDLREELSNKNFHKAKLIAYNIGEQSSLDYYEEHFRDFNKKVKISTRQHLGLFYIIVDAEVFAILGSREESEKCLENLKDSLNGNFIIC